MNATPILSFIVPTAPDWSPYLHRMLRSLAHQTDLRFEVVVAVDGGDDGRIAEVASKPWPFAVVVVDGPRPQGAGIPHRNHARNAALAVARGRWSWVADCDFIWHSRAVAHGLAAALEAEASGEVLALSPTLSVIDDDSAAYLGASAMWAEGETAEKPEQLVRRLRTRDAEWQGKGELYQDTDRPVVDETARMPEGFPLAPTAVFLAMDGFDEAFVRWGGNKIELTYRLGSLEPWVRYRVLRSVVVWHQPHPQDPNKPVDDPHRVANNQRYNRRIAEVKRNDPWWLKQKQAVKRVALEVRGVAREGAPAAMEATRVGILTYADKTKGIARDMELVEECLRVVLRRRAAPEPTIQRYTLSAPRAFLRQPIKSLEGQEWAAFCEAVDVVVISEILPIAAINQALARGVRVAYIPNADWAEVEDDSGRWLTAVRGFALRRGFTVLSKSRGLGAVLDEHRIKHTPIPWVALDPVADDRSPPAQRLRFLASLGMGGFQGRRAADVILEAWRQLGPVDASLTVKIAKPLRDVLPEGFVLPAGVEVIEADWRREQIQAAWLEHDVVLYPTRWDGFGLSLSEALVAGCPVIATDGWPINEQVTDGHDGLLVPARQTGSMRLAPKWEVDPSDLAAAMRRLLDDRCLVRRLTCPHPGRLKAKQHAMRMRLRAVVLGESEPTALVVRGNGEGPDGGRSEDRWAAALREAGWRVLRMLHSEVDAAPVGLDVDFALVGKLATEQASRMRAVVGPETPIVCYHHDLTDYTAQRARWQREIAELVDLCLVSEGGDLARYGGRVERLDAGYHLLERPKACPTPAVDAAVFLGDLEHAGEQRALDVRGFVAAGVPVEVHAHRPESWRAVGIEARSAVHGAEVEDAYAGRIAICCSRSQEREGYTSNRLFCAAGAGALVCARRFPGLDGIYPEGVIGYNSPGEAVAALSAMDAQARLELQWAAIEQTWRRYSWHDRMLELTARTFKVEVNVSKPRVDGKAPAFGRMWEERAKNLGRPGVAHVSWSDSRYHTETEAWWKRMKAQLGRRLKDRDRRLLDFGCGVGRWASRVAREFKIDVTGVDVSPTMVANAKADHPDLDLRVVNPLEPLPFPDDYFDAVMTVTVLQHVPDDEIGHVVGELRRVLKPGGLVFLLENVHGSKRRTSLSGHVVFRPEVEYRRLFPGVVEQESWMVEREKHAIITGRDRG